MLQPCTYAAHDLERNEFLHRNLLLRKPCTYAAHDLGGNEFLHRNLR